MKSTTTPYLRSFSDARKLADNEYKKSPLSDWDQKRDWLKLFTEPERRVGGKQSPKVGLSDSKFKIIFDEARKKNTSLPPKLVNAILEAAKIRKKNKKSSGGKVYKNKTRRANYK